VSRLAFEPEERLLDFRVASHGIDKGDATQGSEHRVAAHGLDTREAWLFIGRAI